MTYALSNSSSGSEIVRPTIQPVGLRGAAVGRLHDAGAAAGADDEPALLGGESASTTRSAGGRARARPRNSPTYAARSSGRLAAAALLGFGELFLAARATGPRRAHEHDGVVDLRARTRLRLEVFREDAQRARVPAVQERVLLYALGCRTRSLPKDRWCSDHDQVPARKRFATMVPWSCSLECDRRMR